MSPPVAPPVAPKTNRPDFERLRTPIVADRVRQIAADGFGFLPHRFLKDGFLSALPPDALVLYVFLVLAANRLGVSFHRYDAICSVLGFHLDRYLQARNALIDGDLIAFDGTRFQVLSLPERPLAVATPAVLRTAADFDEHDPATIRHLIRTSLDRDRQ